MIYALVTLLAAVAADDVKPNGPEVNEYARKMKTLTAQFDEAVEQLTARFREEAKKHRGDLLESLNGKMEAAAKEVDLDTAQKFKSMIEQVQQWSTEPHSVGPASEEVEFPTNAVAFNGHHYLVVDKPTPWHLAAKRCEEVGGHLVRIESADEHQFIIRLLTGKRGAGYHIDGSDEEREGYWRYSNGERVTYIKWAAGAPDNLHDSEHTLSLKWGEDRGLMGDRHGGLRHPYICEWDE